MSSRPTDFGYPSSSMTDSLPNETTPLLVQGSNSTPVSILVKDGLPITRPSSPLSLKQWSRGKSRLFKHRKAKLYKTSSSSTNFQVERDPTASHRNLASDSEDFHDPTQSSIISSATDVHSELGQSCSEVQCRSQSEMALSSPICSSESVLRFHLREGVSLRLQNSGSVARDHLASERTFLAYMRTSLAIASSGVAIVQLFSAASASAHHGSVHRLQVYIRPLGASTIIVGLFVLFIGITRYFTVQAALTKGYFPVARVATGLIAIMLTVLVTLTFGIMLAGKLEPRLGGT
ncbi:hypothetical protein B0H34DRAFT_674696 [Crassisporium funariophilum]|nr:hypothetical protein B0H34DRAFT_674696 [Crassisporium funariophilum]